MTPYGDPDHQLTPTGKGMDLSFLEKPHEHDPRRVYSTTETQRCAADEVARAPRGESPRSAVNPEVLLRR